MRTSLFAAVLAPVLLAALPAAAGDPYVVVVDDGAIESSALQTTAEFEAVKAKVIELYSATGAPLPEVLSVWTTFPLGGSNVGTRFLPYANDVKGINLSSAYGGDGTFESSSPPLRSMLLHNNVMKIPERAAYHRAPEEGYATYLFLLELSHNWGPQIKVPGPGTYDLIGFPFHWSFFMAAGGSPAGGNLWTDNGDGSFSVTVQKPGEVKFSPLDLHLMGLSPPEDVQPFYVITSPVVPEALEDPLWGGGPLMERSFPWFDDTEPVTVTGARRDLTIEDVIAANGARDPVAGTKTSWTLGILLIVSGQADAAAVEEAKQVFSPVAEALAPAFSSATSGKGTLTVVTDLSVVGGAGGAAGGSGGAGGAAASGGTGGDGGSAPLDEGGCGCKTAPTSQIDAPAALLFAAAAISASRRRRPRNPRA